MGKHKKKTHPAFEDLSAEEKERIYREIDEAPPGKIWLESESLTAADRRRFERVKKQLGRLKAGKTARAVSLSVEKELLDAADTVRILRQRVRAAGSGEAGIPAGRVLADIKRRLRGAR